MQQLEQDFFENALVNFAAFNFLECLFTFCVPKITTA